VKSSSTTQTPRLSGRQGTADGSRLEYGSDGCAVARCHTGHDVWTGARVHLGKDQEVYDAELHAIYRAVLTLSQEPRSQKITIFADAQVAFQRITSDVPGPKQRYALAIAQQAHSLWEQRRISVQFRWVPAIQAPPAMRRPTSGQRWQHGTNATRSNCLTSSAALPWPTSSEVSPSGSGLRHAHGWSRA